MSISAFLVYSTLISHVVLVFLVLASIFSRSWGKEIVLFLGKRALLFSLLTALAAVSGSLIYSGVIGFAPCELCWWQRIFLYPQAVIFLIALYKKDGAIFRYTVPMSLIAGMVALYHTYIQLGGTSSLPCAAAGGACAKVFVNEFGYITIPTMSLTIVLYLLIFAWMHKLAQKM
jgi:disulfide bond formation protein DsbB